MDRRILFICLVLATHAGARPSAKVSKNTLLNAVKKAFGKHFDGFDPSTGPLTGVELEDFFNQLTAGTDEFKTYILQQAGHFQNGVDDSNEAVSGALRQVEGDVRDKKTELMVEFKKMEEIAVRAFLLGVEGNAVCAPEDEECLKVQGGVIHQVYSTVAQEIFGELTEADFCSSIHKALAPPMQKRRGPGGRGSGNRRPGNGGQGRPDHEDGDNGGEDEEALMHLLQHLLEEILREVPETSVLRQAIVDDFNCFGQHLDQFVQYLAAPTAKQTPDPDAFLAGIARTHIYLHLLGMQGHSIFEAAGKIRKILEFTPLTGDALSDYHQRLGAAFTDLQQRFADAQSVIDAITSDTGDELAKAIEVLQEDIQRVLGHFEALYHDSDDLNLRAFVLGFVQNPKCDLSDASTRDNCVLERLATMFDQYAVIAEELKAAASGDESCDSLKNLKEEPMSEVIGDFIGEMSHKSHGSSERRGRGDRHGRRSGGSNGDDIDGFMNLPFDLDLGKVRQALASDLGCLGGHIADFVASISSVDPNSLTPEELENQLLRNHIIMRWLQGEGHKVFEIASHIRHYLEFSTGEDPAPPEQTKKSAISLLVKELQQLVRDISAKRRGGHRGGHERLDDGGDTGGDTSRNDGSFGGGEGGSNGGIGGNEGGFEGGNNGDFGSGHSGSHEGSGSGEGGFEGGFFGGHGGFSGGFGGGHGGSHGRGEGGRGSGEGSGDGGSGFDGGFGGFGGEEGQSEGGFESGDGLGGEFGGGQGGFHGFRFPSKKISSGITFDALRKVLKEFSDSRGAHGGSQGPNTGNGDSQGGSRRSNNGKVQGIFSSMARRV